MKHRDRVRFLSSASENDLSVFRRECVSAIEGKTIFADKIYQDNPFWNEEKAYKSNELFTPIKAVKGATVQEKQRNKADDGIFSAAVSSVREPVEAFKELKSAGLLPDCLYIHTLGKFAIAFTFLIFNY